MGLGPPLTHGSVTRQGFQPQVLPGQNMWESAWSQHITPSYHDGGQDSRVVTTGGWVADSSGVDSKAGCSSRELWWKRHLW